MGSTDDAVAKQKANIEARTGRSIDELVALVRANDLQKHGQRVAMLKETLGMGHGDANLVAHLAKAEPAPAGDPADAWYAGAKAAQRPLHDRLLEIVATLGDDVEHAPKKTYLSLRRGKQFATVGPGPRGTVEVGFNLRGAPGDDRVQALPPGKMCTHRARLSTLDEVDDALVGWLERAYTQA